MKSLHSVNGVTSSQLVDGAALKKARLEKCLSVDKFGELVGLSGFYVNSLERGGFTVSKGHLVLIADVLGVSYTELIPQEESATEN